MKILVLCGDKFHPAEVIRRGLSLIQELPGGEKPEFDYVVDAKDILTPDMLREYRVIICAKGNAQTESGDALWFEDGVNEAGPEELREYVENGGGFVSLHSGNSHREWIAPGYTGLVGNSFAGHPARCEVRVFVTKPHPVAEGVEDFTVWDEHYAIDHLAEDRDEFLVSESDEGGRQSAGYTRNVGKGRICVLTPGHVFSVFQEKNFQKLLQGAIMWCADSGK